MTMMKEIHRCFTVVVLLLVLFSNNNNKNCVFSQQQQTVLPTALTNTTTTSNNNNNKNLTLATTNGHTKNATTSTTSSSSSSSTSSSSSSTAAVLATATKSNNNTTSEILRNFESDEDLLESSAEIFNDSDDVAQPSIIPTTYRPVRPSIAPHTSAQERERKLMNVLAARRSALHRGVGFRTRVGTTGRTAISSATSIETTSKSPTDPRSICIRNCTKNFTRRTTASCMRQCANFQRNFNNNNTTVVVKPSSKTGLGTQTADRDNNEILFTDESSHGLFVVAKEQNGTANHIPDVDVKSVATVVTTDGNKLPTKYRSRGKPAAAFAAVTAASVTSIEDDDIAPYLYFGQKLPPIKPASLTITSVSDEHPRLLEVSVASTTPTAIGRPKATLSAVERSRSRYKYNMRDRSTVAFNRRHSSGGSIVSGGGARPTAAALLSNATVELKPLAVTEAAIVTTVAPKQVETSMEEKEIVKEVPIIPTSIGPRLGTFVMASAPPIPTPLLITVLGEEEAVTQQAMIENATTVLPVVVYKPNRTTTTTTTTTTTSTTTTSTTTTTVPTTTTTTTPKPTTTTTTTTTTPKPNTTTRTTTTTTTTPKTTTSTTTTTPKTTTSTTTTTTTAKPLPKPTTTTSPPPAEPPNSQKPLSDKDVENLRALVPELKQDDQNIVLFYRTPGEIASSTTDAAILRTTVLTSIRSTVNPRPTAASDAAKPKSGVRSALGGDISSTIVSDEREVTIEMHRMNVATYVLIGIGIFPLIAVVVYLVRNYVIKRHNKDNDVFDVCVTDQQPISPVKKLDSKYFNHDDDDEDEVDHHQSHHQQQHHHVSSSAAAGHQKQQHSHHQRQLSRDDNYNIKNNNGSSNNNSPNNNNNNSRYDEHCSVMSVEEFDRKNLRLKSLLGEGNFGQVWKAEADDLSGHFGATRIVAVKTVRACSAQVGLKDEANIMRKLGSHTNVVTLLGACVESEPHMLIMEYAMRGRLLSLLRAARSATNILPASVPGGRSLAPLSPRTLAGFALDIACGMEYIAERRIVHRDLAARNVLLDHNGVCKICDFGMSIDLDIERSTKKKAMRKRREEELAVKNCANEIARSNSQKFKFDFGGRFIMQHWNSGFSSGGGNNEQQQKPQKDTPSEKKSHGHDTISRRPALPIRWMAPEALQYHIFTTATDVWAFGIVLWEIATLGSTPYSHLTGREVIRNVPNGLRPDLPKEGRHEFYNLMARCWHKEQHLRPSFTQARLEISRSLGKWVEDESAASDYMDVSGFSEDLEHGMVYFNHRISEFECEI